MGCITAHYCLQGVLHRESNRLLVMDWLLPPAEAPSEDDSVPDATLVTRAGLYVHEVPQISTFNRTNY